MTDFPEEAIKKEIRRIALLNSISHAGRPDRAAVIGRLMAERADLRDERERVSSLALKVIAEISNISIDVQKGLLFREFPGALEKESERKKEISKRDSGRVSTLPTLPNAKMGAVVTRFPPEPNGFMHIGHAKAAILGSEYARIYNGRFIVRFDDTNPAAERKEYYGTFLESLSWLKIKPDMVKNASDDLDKFYEIAMKMIENLSAYVCSCSQEVMRLKRGKGENCEHRGQSRELNLELWDKMLNGKNMGSVLRFRGDMTSLNTAIRDPVLFRIVDEPHPILGGKYKVWPTYDFDGPVEDSLDGVTHAMRSKEYELRDELYQDILDSIGLRKPEIIEFSRLTLQNTTVSKRNLRKLIEEKKVEGWDDPRLPTISGLKRRGILPESIREFVLSMGLSKVEAEPTWDLLESINRRILDPVAKRYFFVPAPVLAIVKGAPEKEVRLKYHPERTDHRIVKTKDRFFLPSADIESVKAGEKIRLIEAYNIRILHRRSEVIDCEYSGEEMVEGIPKVQWVNEEHVPMSIKIPGQLLEKGEFNPKSLKIESGYAELATNELELGEIVQFVRFGFCRMDEKGYAIFAHR